METDSDKLLMSAIQLTLALTYEERIEAHNRALELLLDLKQAGMDNRAQSQSFTS